MVVKLSGKKSVSSKNGTAHRFYLIEPIENADLDSIANVLAGLEHVKEVSLADGSYGIIVKAAMPNGKEHANIADFISNKIGCKFGVLDVYYSYRKA